MSEYIINETIRINCTYTDIAGDLYDPTTISLKIFDPSGSLLKTVTYADAEIIKSGVGIYYYDYKITGNVGYYITHWIGTADGFDDVSEDQFYANKIQNKLYISVQDVKDALMVSGITMDDSIIKRQISLAMAEVDTIMGRSFNNETDYTEWFDTLTKNPNNGIDQLFLSKLPVQSITSVKEYNKGSLTKTYESDDYYLSDNFLVQLYQGSFYKGLHAIEVKYTFGYDAVPLKISMLTSIITQIIVMREYMIGQDNAITGFSIPDISQIQVGETYVSTERALAGLNKQKDLLITEIGNLKNDVFIN